MLLPAVPAVAQVTCRTDALGATVCIGTPPPALAPRPAFPSPPRGLDRVQRPAGTESVTRLVPEARSDALGNTILQPGDLPPPRDRRGLEPQLRCEPDALGNQICR